MLAARDRLAAPFLCAILLVACGGAVRGRPVIGLAYPPWSGIYVTEAESSLRRAWGDTAILPQFVFDTVPALETADRSIAWAQQLLRTPGLSVIVGPSASHTALAIAPAINAASIPEIIPTATSRHLDQVGPWTFRLVADDSVEAEFLVRQIVARGDLHRVLLLFVNDAYGQGLRSALHDALGRAGLLLTAELSVSAESDFDALFRSEFRQRPPEVILGAFRNPDLAAAARALEHLGSRRPIFVSDGAYGPKALHDAEPRLSFDIYGAALWLPDPADSAARRFRDDFRRVAGWDPRPEDALIHDALLLAATAVRESHGDPGGVRRWLLSLGGSRPPFPGAAGPIDLRSANARPLRLGRFAGDSAVRADLP